MIADILALGPIIFDDFSTPDIFSAGGRQAMVVHRLPGGSRVIDLLGPDEMEIVWRGQFFGSGAYETALQLDALRQQGQQLTLIFAGQTRQVIINNYIYSLRRYPIYIEYAITCTVVTGPPSSQSSASQVDQQVTNDLSNGSDTTGNSGVWGSSGPSGTLTTGPPAAGGIPFQ